jgi:hypothetical protein
VIQRWRIVDRGHPALQRGIWGFGSLKKNAAAYDVLPLGDPPYGHPRWQP